MMPFGNKCVHFLGLPYKVAQIEMGKLKTTDIYFPQFWRLELNQDVGRTLPLFEDLREKFPLAFHRLLVVAGSLWCSSCL